MIKKRINIKDLPNIYFTLITFAFLGTSINADTLYEALSNANVNGEVRSMTILATESDAKESNILNNSKASAIALQLNYVTKDFYGFKGKIGFQTSHNLGINDESDPNPTTGENEPRVTVEGTNMYLASISYSFANTTIKVGRQLISTPLIAGSNLHPLRDSFNALSIVNKDLTQTKITLYLIKEWYQRYTAEDGSSKATDFDKPLYSLHIKNSSIKDLKLEGQYFITKNKGSNKDLPIPVIDGYSMYLALFDYKLATSLPLSVGGLYSGATFDKKGEKDSSFYGVKVGTKISNIGVKLAYTLVSDDNDFPGTLGHIPNFFKYNGGQMYTENIFAGVSTTSILLVPNVSIAGVKILISYSKYAQTDKGISVTKSGFNLDGASELQFDLRYRFSGLLKGFSTRLQLAQLDYDNNTIADDKNSVGRFFLNYKF